MAPALSFSLHQTIYNILINLNAISCCSLDVQNPLLSCIHEWGHFEACSCNVLYSIPTLKLLIPKYISIYFADTHLVAMLL